MEALKLTFNILPKGAWNNDFSKTLSKKHWNNLREFALKRANGRSEICGYKTDDLDVHEDWEFDVIQKTQTLKKIIAICSRCHGVKHFKNSVRLGFGEEAQRHFMMVNNCSEMQFAKHLNKSLIEYEERNKIFRWKIIANLEKFGGKGIDYKQNTIPLIKNPYENIDWDTLSYNKTKTLFDTKRNDNLIGAPKIITIEVDNYQGMLCVKSLFADRIEWFLDGKKLKTKYHNAGLFKTELKVKNLTGKQLNFKITGIGGETTSKTFELLPLEVL